MMRIVWIVVFLASFGLNGKYVMAQGADQEKTYKAKITEMLEEKEIEVDGVRQTYQKMILDVTKEKESRPIKVMIENGGQPLANQIVYKLGQKVMVSQGEEGWRIVDFDRRSPLLSLTVIFVVAVILVARFRGGMSLIGMVWSFLVILKYLVPQILIGREPITVSLIASALIMPVSFLLSHGWNKKTWAALIGSLLALAATGALAALYVKLAYLTGLASEEAGFVGVAKAGIVDLQGLLLAGIIVGTLGVLDDVTISQASIVKEIYDNGKKPKPWKVFISAMNVGKDHITSMVNTLFLAYAGASLPLLLLFGDSQRGVYEIVNLEIIAEEIVRTLVGSIGLILAVPITTILAVIWMRNQDQKLKIKDQN